MAAPHQAVPTTAYSAIGLDLGGSSIKYGIVAQDGTLVEGTFGQAPTPAGAHPTDVAQTMLGVLDTLAELTGQDLAGIPVGVTVPGIVTHGTVYSAANIDPSWVGLDAQRLLTEVLGHPVSVLNDADAAGVAEVYAGAGRDASGAPAKGTTLVLTLGTGIGSALFRDGVLFPNLEFGHLEIDSQVAESRAAARVIRAENLSWEQYIQRLQRYLSHVEFLCSPDLIVIGGAVSEDHEKFLPALKLRARILPAKNHNAAGVLGAAHLAQLAISN